MNIYTLFHFNPQNNTSLPPRLLAPPFTEESKESRFREVKKLVQAFLTPLLGAVFSSTLSLEISAEVTVGGGSLCKVVEVNVTGVSMGVEQLSTEGESKSYGFY